MTFRKNGPRGLLKLKSARPKGCLLPPGKLGFADEADEVRYHSIHHG